MRNFPTHNRLSTALVVVMLFLLCAIASRPATLIAQEKIQWRMGKDFPKQLDSIVGVTWSNNPLRSALKNLGQSQRVAVMLDRRVDPGRRITFSLTGRPLGELFATLAHQQKLGVAYIGPVAYFGPPETTAKLATLVEMRREDIRQLPSAVHVKLLNATRMNWTAPAQPRQLIEKEGKAVGVRPWKIEGDVPHDLWPGWSLPPLDFAQRMTLLLAGFNKTFEIAKDGSAFRVVDIPDKPVIKRQYILRRGSGTTLAELEKQFPHTKFELAGTRLTAHGSIEDLRKVSLLLAPKKPPSSGNNGQPKTTEQRYTLIITNKPIGPVITQLSQLHLKLEPVFADNVTDADRQKLVSFKVEKVNLDGLLRAALEPAGLDYRIEGEKLHIFRATQP